MPDPRFPHETDIAAEGSPLAVDADWRSVDRGLRLVRTGLVLFMVVLAGAALGGACLAAGNLSPGPVFGGRRGSTAAFPMQQTLDVVSALIGVGCAAVGLAGVGMCVLGHLVWLRVPARTGARRWAAASFGGTLAAIVAVVTAAIFVLLEQYLAAVAATAGYVLLQAGENVASLLFLRRIAQYLDAARLVLAVHRFLVVYGLTLFVDVCANAYGYFATPPMLTGGWAYDPVATLANLATLAVAMGLAWAALGLLDQTGEALKYGRDPQPPARGIPHAVH
jgi:hypothetical protein